MPGEVEKKRLRFIRAKLIVLFQDALASVEMIRRGLLPGAWVEGEYIILTEDSIRFYQDNFPWIVDKGEDPKEVVEWAARKHGGEVIKLRVGDREVLAAKIHVADHVTSFLSSFLTNDEIDLLSKALGGTLDLKESLRDGTLKYRVPPAEFLRFLFDDNYFKEILKRGGVSG